MNQSNGSDQKGDAVKSLFISATLCVLLAGSASAQTSPQVNSDAHSAPPANAPEPMAAPTITADTVVYTQADLSDYAGDYYPPRAQEDEVQGKVVLACEIGDAGRVAQCIVVSETPAGYGFGKSAALTILKYGRADPSKSSVGGWLRMTMNFTLS